MKILKFGGKSLANGKGIEAVIAIIVSKLEKKEKIVVVLSARGTATSELEKILEKAASSIPYKDELDAFKLYQLQPLPSLDFSEEYNRLELLLAGVSLLQEYSAKIKDEILAYGELLSIKMLAQLLNNRGIKAAAIDGRTLLKTDNNYGNAQPIHSISKQNVLTYFSNHPADTVGIVSGYIASNIQNKTTTLGRNGSNYTAALLSQYLAAEELENYTHVNGIYTANPDLVADAIKIEHLSYEEANELANFGASILHSKTILPLIENKIQLRILNTFRAGDKGTLISSNTNANGIKSISVIDNVSLIHLEGRGLLGKIGVDARIFNSLSKKQISVSIISQGSSERGLGFIVPRQEARNAIEALEKEFEKELLADDVHKISSIDDVSVISIIGIELFQFQQPFHALIKNQITPLLINNTLNGKNVSVVVQKNQQHKALNVIHSQIFGVAKKINIAIFGKGLVGGTLIDQIIENTASVLKRNNILLRIFAIADSKQVLLSTTGIAGDWIQNLQKNGRGYSDPSSVIAFAKTHHLENLIAVDNTASASFIEHYIPLVEAGFDLVSSNKIANTVSHSFYKLLREKLVSNKKEYLYETNVGAGLPLIDTIRLLHESGENITSIRGVFSGSLSYIFNTYSIEQQSFSETLQAAIDLGYTEPDPREDLCGNDVARKLLILARELDLENEMEDIHIDNLIPEPLRKIPASDFIGHLDALNASFHAIKVAQKPNHVLRYIGELSGDLFKSKGILNVKLASVPANSSLGSLRGSDAFFEIYTESYGERPIIIQGAGAGKNVTARGVFGDILRLAKNNQ